MRALKRGQAKNSKAPNKKLLIILGVLALVFVVKMAMPSLFGGGGGSKPSSATRSTFQIHKATKQATKPGVGGTTGTVTRTGRDPFAAPAGY